MKRPPAHLSNSAPARDPGLDPSAGMGAWTVSVQETPRANSQADAELVRRILARWIARQIHHAHGGVRV